MGQAPLKFVSSEGTTFFVSIDHTKRVRVPRGFTYCQVPAELSSKLTDEEWRFLVTTFAEIVREQDDHFVKDCVFDLFREYYHLNLMYQKVVRSNKTMEHRLGITLPIGYATDRRKASSKVIPTRSRFY